MADLSAAYPSLTKRKVEIGVYDVWVKRRQPRDCNYGHVPLINLVYYTINSFYYKAFRLIIKAVRLIEKQFVLL